MNPILVKNNNIDSCTILFLFNVGSINEDKNILGISHFIEHMIFKGNQQIKKSNILLNKLDSIGGDYNAFTTNNLTGYHIKVMKEYQLEAFEILYNMLFRSIFDTNEIDTEREVIKEEYSKDEYDIDSVVDEMIQKMVLRNTPYSKSIIGKIKTINNIKKKDLIQYWKKYYNLNNCVVIINGNINNNLMNYLKNIKLKQFPFKFLEYKINIPKNPSIKIIKTEDNQTKLSIAFRTCGLNNDDKYVLDLISNIIGGNMSSRLFLSLREKYGIVYEIDCNNTFFRDIGYLQITCSFDNKNILKIIKIILKELMVLKTNYITKEELIVNKSYLRSMELLSFEDTISFCEDIATEYILTGKINMPEKNIQHYNNINKYQIKNISSQIFTKNNLNMIILGNYNDKKILSEINQKISEF